MRRSAELTGHYSAVHAFLPGRDITHLQWITDLDDPMDASTGLDAGRLAHSLRKLISLKFGGYFPRWVLCTWYQPILSRPHLRNISVHLENLVFLESIGPEKVQTLTFVVLFLLIGNQEWRRRIDCHVTVVKVVQTVKGYFTYRRLRSIYHCAVWRI